MPHPVAVPNDSDEPDASVGRIVTAHYEGHDYSYDLDAITIDALEDFDDAKYIRAVRAILGPEQWAAYKARHPKIVDLDRFMGALLAAAGDSGNPSASSAS